MMNEKYSEKMSANDFNIKAQFQPLSIRGSVVNTPVTLDSRIHLERKIESFEQLQRKDKNNNSSVTHSNSHSSASRHESRKSNRETENYSPKKQQGESISLRIIKPAIQAQADSQNCTDERSGSPISHKEQNENKEIWRKQSENSNLNKAESSADETEHSNCIEKSRKTASETPKSEFGTDSLSPLEKTGRHKIRFYV